MRFTHAIYVALTACSIVAAMPPPVIEPALAVRDNAVSGFATHYEGGNEAGIKKRYDGDVEKVTMRRRDNAVSGFATRYEGRDEAGIKKRYDGDAEKETMGGRR